ncbi:MAG: hypothetical protein QOH58_3556 [Thermoleophilaceae bacterium]|jgi:cell division septation protein DedD|nr:hypothetical protein [Thermoleophilaceae bacterium]
MTFASRALLAGAVALVALAAVLLLPRDGGARTDGFSRANEFLDVPPRGR